MISIIIPTLNEESVIEKTLLSLKRLTLPHEVIISDGNSKDKTIEIAQRLADKVIVHTTPERQTIAAGRNAGADARSADCKYVIFIDADCQIMEPDRFFTKMIADFDQDPKLVAANVAIRVLPEFETLPDKLIFSSMNEYMWFVNNVLHLAVSAGEFQMFRNETFKAIGGYDPKLVAAEDVDIFQRMSKIGKVRFEKGLTIYHTGRRAHKIGWPKLLSLWIINPVWMMIRGKALSSEWKPIR
jgi:glycosyltransferase involved in cell wall biosynthesis